MKQHNRNIKILMSYPEICAVEKTEIDEFILFVKRLTIAYFCGDHEITLLINDEYGLRTEEI